MSGPIQNKPNVDKIVPNPQSVNERGQELKKVTEVAIGALGSFRPPSPPLNPTRVELAVLKSFRWLWNFEEENDHLIWETKASESGIRLANKEQYPVLQPTYEFLKDLFLTAERKDSVDFLETMGFSYEVGEFRTPTREQLVINYNRYQEKHPEFPKLVFKMSDEILEPDEFISSVLETDFILSDGQDLIHDYTYHTIPTLIGIFQAPKSYRSYKDLLGQTVRTFLEFLNQEPMEILTQLNNHLITPIEESDIIDIIATLKYMVGAALDVLTGQIFDYEKIIKKGDAWGGVKLKFFKYLWNALTDERWRPSLERSIPSLKQDFFENYSLRKWHDIVDTIFTVTGLNKGSLKQRNDPF
ncbi:MAG: hypothetical protein EB053_04065 [Chlamydiae bacterium]|nr:hypothetical protein [Chlamydiota bacterium]